MHINNINNSESLGIYGWENGIGTSNRESEDGSWKEHWKKATNRSWPNVCCVEGCNNQAVLGAHIRKVYGNNKKYYIAPMCDRCNKIKGSFNLKNRTLLVYENHNEYVILECNDVFGRCY